MLLETVNNPFPKKTVGHVFSMNLKALCILFSLFLSFCSKDVLANDTGRFSIFAVNESNLNDSIVGVGVSALHKINDTNFALSVNTSLSNADVIDVSGHQQSYLAWELGAKFGYFSTLFLYAEFGFDFGEFALQDRDEDSYGYYQNNRNEEVYYYDNYSIDIRPDVDDYSNDIDAYLGIGTGVNFGHLQLSAFARYRQIDGEFWKASNQTFTGVKASLSF